MVASEKFRWTARTVSLWLRDAVRTVESAQDLWSRWLDDGDRVALADFDEISEEAASVKQDYANEIESFESDIPEWDISMSRDPTGMQEEGVELHEDWQIEGDALYATLQDMLEVLEGIQTAASNVREVNGNPDALGDEERQFMNKLLFDKGERVIQEANTHRGVQRVNDG